LAPLSQLTSHAGNQMSTETIDLDSEELLHLALQASKTGQHESCVLLLKRLLAKDPQNARAFYLLGAEHAQIGLYDRAKDEMARAIELSPGMHAARFQLGMLFITSGQVEPALTAFAPLSADSASEPFHSFAKGMEFLAQDAFSECKEALEHGIATNHSNEPLNDDMRKILAAIEAKVDAAVAAKSGVESVEWLSAYHADSDN
jgi:tetratricopeptide (TPR) repeat protein